MNLPKSPRYYIATNAAYEYLIDHGIGEVPIDVYGIFKKNSHYKLITFEDWCKKNNIVRYLEIYRKRVSALTTYLGNGNYRIIFNQYKKHNIRKSIEEIRFDLAHELGHIILGHHIYFDIPDYEICENTVLEREADVFARNLLEPIHFMLLLKINVEDEADKFVKLIQSLFCVTKKAAKVRCIKWLQQSDYYYTSKDTQRKIIELFLPKKHWFTWYKRCRTCGNEIIDDDIKCCPICGESNFNTYSIDNFIEIHKNRGKCNMIYPGVNVDENGKAMRCPVCDNEEIQDDGEFCSQCGTYLVNKCADTWGQEEFGNDPELNKSCGHILGGNQRYCPYCGNESTFLQNGILKPWKEIVKEANNQEDDSKEEAAATAEQTPADPFADDSKPIDISDDDLPF